MIRIAHPIISRQKISYNFYDEKEESYVHKVNGLLSAKILKALSDVHIADRENILLAADLFYKGV